MREYIGYSDLMIMLSSPSTLYLDSGIIQQTAAHMRQ